MSKDDANQCCSAAKNTYGTGCFLVYNVGDKPVISRNGLLGTLAYDFRGVAGLEKATYALEGSIAVAGSAVKFLTNNFRWANGESAGITKLAESVEDNGGCYFVTAFSGLFAPYWIDDAKGTMFGMCFSLACSSFSFPLAFIMLQIAASGH